MIPQIGFIEIMVLGILALVVLGPKDLPLMMRKFGRITGKMRMMAFEFRQSFDELGRQAELEELRKEVEALKKETGIDELTRDLEATESDIAKDAGDAANALKADLEKTGAKAEKKLEEDKAKLETGKSSDSEAAS